MKPQAPCIPGLLDPQLRTLPRPRFDGPVYEPEHDQARLTGHMARIYELMADGHWRSLGELSLATGVPEASASAFLRHLRKRRFGGHVIERRPRGDRKQGLYEYRLNRGTA